MSGPLRVEPLWVRVDRNRVKLAVFVVLFIGGSALLLSTALVLVPGSLLGILAPDYSAWIRQVFVWAGVAFLALVALGALLGAIQLSNAEDWVRNRFGGMEMAPGKTPGLESVAADIALAAGLPTAPRLMLLDSDAINACIIGMNRSNPVLGVTRGFVSGLSAEEQRAVIATLVARLVAGDVLFATALAALMGPLKAIRDMPKHGTDIAAGCADAGCSDPGCLDAGSGCSGDGCSGIGDSDDAAGCVGAIGIVLFLAFVAAVTYLAVLGSAWLVTLWGRALHRTAYEKADAEGMLLLKDPAPMLSALAKVSASSNAAGDGDRSYDGIFYAQTSGTPSIERIERRRYQRLREVLGTDGLAAPDLPT